MSSLDAFAAQKLDDLEARGLRRRLVVTEREAAALARRGTGGQQRRLVSFCCNDYLNLSQDERVKQAAAEAALTAGAGAGASRLITGNHALYERLEQRLAAFKGTAAAVVFGSGYLANLGIVPALVGKDDLVLVDELAHACLFAGARLAGAALAVFRHNDMNHLETVLQERRAAHGQALILTDGVFSMDGDLAPLAELTALARRFDAWLMTDDAHGLGVLGEGRGSTAHAIQRAAGGEEVEVPLQMGTLSKAVGAYGGYLCASRPVVDLIKTRARTFIYTTALPPPVVAAALAALEIIEHEASRRRRALDHARLFAELVGLPRPEACIVPLVLGESAAALAASHALEEEGFLVTAIRPPTVPDGTARLRFTFTADHREDDIRRLAACVRARFLPRESA